MPNTDTIDEYDNQKEIGSDPGSKTEAEQNPWLTAYMNPSFCLSRRIFLQEVDVIEINPISQGHNFW